MTSYEPPYEILPIWNKKDWNSTKTSTEIATTSAGAGSDSYDAFGRLRVSEIGNRYDVEFTYDTQPLLTRQVISGNATIAHNSTYRDVRLSIVDTDANTSALFCSSYNTPYTPACSQLIDITGTMDLAGIGGGEMSIFHKFFGNTTTYTQSNWLYKSKAETCDWTKSQIFSIDFQSLKIGTLRFYLVRDGVQQQVHYINNDNVRNTGYWEHPNLRPYWKIYNDSANTISEIGYGDKNCGVGFRYTQTANSSASMSAVCATVKSEGGLDIFSMAGYPCATSNYLTSVSVSSSLIPILSIKVYPTFNSIYNCAIVIPEEITIVNDNPIIYRLVLNPTLANTSFTQVEANSSVYKDVSANSISGGTIIDEDYIASGLTKTSSTNKALGRIILAPNFAGTDGDILTIAGIRTTNSSSATTARIRWREIR